MAYKLIERSQLLPNEITIEFFIVFSWYFSLLLKDATSNDESFFEVSPA